MGLLTRMADISPQQAYPNGSDYWYQPRGFQTLAGNQIDAESAKTIPSVYACVRVIAETLATVPLDLYKRETDGSKARYLKHPLQETLHNQANPYQTALEFREFMTAVALLRGSSFAFIHQPDPTYDKYELIPLHPDLMSVRYAGQYGERRRYFYGSRQEELQPEDVFHLRAFDGLGIAYALRETLALTKAAEEYGTRFFGQGQRPVGFLSVPQNEKRIPMQDATFDRMRTQLKELYGGNRNAHQIAVLEDGVTWQAMGLTAESSQFLQTRKFQTEEIARVFRIPPHKIGQLDRSTYSNIEAQGIEFVTDCIRPWCVRWEQTIRRDLITQPDLYFAEHNLDGLLRGDTQARYAAYMIAIDRGIMSPNEVRNRENMNDRLDPWGDAYVRQLNQTTTADAAVAPAQKVPSNAPGGPPQPGQPGKVPSPPNPVPGPGKAANGSRHPVLMAAAARLAAREQHALMTMPNDADPNEWPKAFYDKHAIVMSEALALPLEKSAAFCDAQRDRLATYGKLKMIEWMGPIVEELVQMSDDHRRSQL